MAANPTNPMRVQLAGKIIAQEDPFEVVVGHRLSAMQVEGIAIMIGGQIAMEPDNASRALSQRPLCRDHSMDQGLQSRNMFIFTFRGWYGNPSPLDIIFSPHVLENTRPCHRATAT